MLTQSVTVPENGAAFAAGVANYQNITGASDATFLHSIIPNLTSGSGSARRTTSGGVTFTGTSLGGGRSTIIFPINPVAAPVVSPVIRRRQQSNLIML